MSEIIVSMDRITKRFSEKGSGLFGRKKSFLAVEELSLFIQKGECLGIVGESGSGKSTTAEILGGLQKADSGSVLFHGVELREMDRRLYRHFRRNVQYIFQDPKGSLNPYETVRELLMEPLLTLKIERNPKKRREAAEEICAAVGLEQSVLQKFPTELSGGQAQRVCIGRAIIGKPELVICDEAVSALDVSVQAQILNLLKQLQKDYGISYLFISHDIAAVNFMADRVLVMQKGRLVEEGEIEEVLQNPKEEYTRKLLAAVL